MLDGRVFARFHADVGFGDVVVGATEELHGDDLLDFAGIERARAIAISREQQFAEKVHAYSIPWTDRVNTRSRDLIDLVLLIERGGLNATIVREAVSSVFRRRARHSVPQQLAPPPAVWTAEYRSMAAEVGVRAAELDAGFAELEGYWTAEIVGTR